MGVIENQQLTLSSNAVINTKFSNLRHKTASVPKIFAALL